MELKDSNIIEFNRAELVDRNTVVSLYSIKQPSERARIQALMLMRAKEIAPPVDKELEAMFKKMDSAEKAASEKAAAQRRKEYSAQHTFQLKFNDKGQPLASIENFLMIIRNDQYFQSLRLNLLSYAPEHTRDSVITRWTDADDSDAREYIERIYEIHNAAKLDDALRIVFRDNQYHPIRDIIETIEWDGKERINTLLHKWLKCIDTPYTREVSRLIFAGGIHRLYNPGCKFDDMPVLVGTKQGEGKSSFIQWLALDDKFFTEVTTMEGQQGVEAIEGAWICEITELLALTKLREMEAAKSYISRRNDRYRRPFDKRVTEAPRQCIFIGTTNKEQFLTDKTGNRRFYPVRVGCSGYELFGARAEIMQDIRQCWAEAKAKMDAGAMPPFADRELISVIRENQAAAAEEDYREGAISEYLVDKDMVCAIELWKHALDNPYTKPGRYDSNEIVLIMQGMDGWKREDKTMWTKEYGAQRVWTKIKSVTKQSPSSDHVIFETIEDDGPMPF